MDVEWDRSAYDVAMIVRDLLDLCADFEITGHGVSMEGVGGVTVRCRGREYAIQVRELLVVDQTAGPDHDAETGGA